jgi:sporulation protein YlmC with PRC-barrel domain
VTTYAVAQDDSTKSGAGKSGSNSSGAPPGSGTSSRSGSSSGLGASSGTSMGQPIRLSKLMQQTINGQSGQHLGTVRDVVLDPASGQIQFVVLSLSGAGAAGSPGTSSSTSTGIGASSSSSTSSGIGSTSSSSSGNLVAVPWSLVQQGGSDQFTVNVDQSKLQSAPTFSAGSWPSMDSTWSQQINSHFGVSATGAPGSSSGTSGSNMHARKQRFADWQSIDARPAAHARHT